MPLNNERPTSTSSGEDQGSDVDSSSERHDSVTSTSDGEFSRASFTSDSSSKHCTPSSSPPKILTLDEVMTAAQDIISLKFAHELIMNRNILREPVNLPQNSLWKIVKDTVHKAYWDILESELKEDPPQYEHAIKLVEEIREILLSFLNPGANRMRTQIMEILDVDLIRQQADNNAVDIQGLASSIITTMGKLCAPCRDEELNKLQRGSDNIVMLFKEIFRVLDLMKMDAINSEIDFLRPMLQSMSVDCERSMFQRILDKTPTALRHTTSWIKASIEELLLASNSNMGQTSSQEKQQKVLPGPFQILNNAFLHILTWDLSKSPMPETLMTQELQLREIQSQLQQYQAINEVLLIVYSTVGGPIQGLASLSERLKRMASVLLDGMHSPHFNLEEALKGASEQICCELNKSLTERDYPALTPALQATLTGQICNITQRDNPIRTLVEDRVHQYFKMLLRDPKPQVKLEEVPAGLSAIKPELMSLGAKYVSLVKYNISTYGPFYSDIIRKLMFSDSPPAPTPPVDTAQDSVTSS
ncbi:T-complex protein 11-like protein 2 [Genypterus blacodes]|uniref:T-complex protein 11-like protein 2 n=1 Tax=Genypterus blacodes TaxID=154954 RepID=UPI003F7649F6